MLCKKRLYKGLSKKSYSVDLMPSKILYKALTNSVENTYNNYGAVLQHGASPVVSFSRVFFLYIRNTWYGWLFIFFSFFFFF